MDNEAQTVRRIYKMYLSGMGLAAIAEKLSKDGIKTATGKNTWTASTIKSILQNEKYKGSALLQKKYTVDFLTKKLRKNMGEVPQYYVEDSHPAIINSDQWELVQAEFERRREAGNRFSANNIFSSRIVCSDCGSFYGPKILNSTSKYRKTIWRCNHKYASEGNTGKHCRTPNLTEDDIKTKFLDAVNEIMADREKILDGCRELLNKYSDTSAIDKKICTLMEEAEVISNLNRQLIEKNSKTPMNQEEFIEKYNGYVGAFEEKSAAIEKLKLKRIAQENKANNISGFMFELHEREWIVTEFSTEFWNKMIDVATVNRDGSITFRFKDGREIIK